MTKDLEITVIGRVALVSQKHFQFYKFTPFIFYSAWVHRFTLFHRYFTARIMSTLEFAKTIPKEVVDKLEARQIR